MNAQGGLTPWRPPSPVYQTEGEEILPPPRIATIGSKEVSSSRNDHQACGAGRQTSMA